MHPARPHRLKGLDALRGIAAVAVVVHHAGLLARFDALHQNGYLAVDFFFMLSGFVLAHGYAEPLRMRRLTAMALLRMRIDRLYPMILLGVALGSVVAMLTTDVPLVLIGRAALSGLVLLPTTQADVVFPAPWPIDPPLWSLAWEIVASIAFAACLHRLRTRWLAVVQLVALAALAWRATVHGSLEIGFDHAHLEGGAVRIAFAFVTGLLLRRWWHRRPRAPGRFAVRDLALLLMLLLFLPVGEWRVPYAIAVVALAFPAIVLAAADAVPRATGWATGAALSYPLYLVHFPVMLAMQRMLGEAPGMTPAWLAAMLVAVGMLAGAAALRWWETPWQDRRTRVLGKPSRKRRGSLYRL